MGTALAIFDLYVTSILHIKFRVDWPFSSGEILNRFSKWRPWRPSWISDRNDVRYFLTIYKSHLFLSSFENWPFGSEEVQNTFLKMAAVMAILNF